MEASTSELTAAAFDTKRAILSKRDMYGRLYSSAGDELPAERPLHLFARWYGFSLTFPNCEIYGDAGEGSG